MKDFLRGVGSVINLFPSDRNITLLPKHSDTDALRSDWEKAGKDIQLAIEESHLKKIQQKTHE